MSRKARRYAARACACACEALPEGSAPGCFQGYVFKIYPGAGEKSGIKLPVGKGIPLITDAKIVKKPRRKQLNNRVGLVWSDFEATECGVRFLTVLVSDVISLH